MQVVPFWFSFLVQTLALQSTRHRLSSVIINIWEYLGYDIMSRDLKFLGFPWRMVLTKIKHRQVMLSTSGNDWKLIFGFTSSSRGPKQQPRISACELSHSHQHGNDVGGRWWSRQGWHHRPGRFRSMAKQIFFDLFTLCRCPSNKIFRYFLIQHWWLISTSLIW